MPVCALPPLVIASPNFYLRHCEPEGRGNLSRWCRNALSLLRRLRLPRLRLAALAHHRNDVFGGEAYILTILEQVLT